MIAALKKLASRASRAFRAMRFKFKTSKKGKDVEAFKYMPSSNVECHGIVFDNTPGQQ